MISPGNRNQNNSGETIAKGDSGEAPAAARRYNHSKVRRGKPAKNQVTGNSTAIEIGSSAPTFHACQAYLPPTQGSKTSLGTTK